jgi:segregation and condensation protein B
MPEQTDPTPNVDGEMPRETAGSASEESLRTVYAALLENQAWQLDTADPSSAGPVEAFIDSSAPIGEENSRHAHQIATIAETAASSSSKLPPSAHRILEALLFIGGGPLNCDQACAVVPGMTPVEFLRCLDTLNRSYRLQGRPYQIRATNKACELVLRPKFLAVVEKILGASREARLSSAALDVLSLVAYRQPLTKQEIDGMRGAESGAVLRQLVRRGLLTVVHQENEGKAEPVYCTTRRFVEFFQLRGLEDLPQTQDLQRL